MELSANLLFLCLACLNEKINFTNKSSVLNLIGQRNIIAKTALKSGIDKSLLVNKIQSIDKNDYPTLKQIQRIVKVIENNDYSFNSNFIPDKMIHYKTEEELKADLKRIPKERKAIDIDFINLCEYVKHEVLFYTNYDLTEQQKNYLKRLKISSYSYSIILQCFKEYHNEIDIALKQNNFKSDFNKLCYACAIVKNHLVEVVKCNERKLKEDKEFWDSNAKAIVNGDETLESMIEIQCERYPDSGYYMQHDVVRKELLEAINRIKNERKTN